MSYPKRGEIYLVDLSGRSKDTKARPALIVSMHIKNHLANDVIVVPISTTLRSSPTHVQLARGEGGLHKPSLAKCEQITTLDKSLLVRGPFSATIKPETIIHLP
jgi:mRNA interferase MazF